MDKNYELRLVETVLRKYKEREHTLEVQAMSGQLEYMSARDRTDHEFEYRDVTLVIRALEAYMEILKKNSLETTN